MSSQDNQAENNYYDELIEKLGTNETDKNIINNYFINNVDFPILKKEDDDTVEAAKKHYNFKKSENSKIFTPYKPDIMKLVCLVRFIWDSNELVNTDANSFGHIAKYMLMGYRLDSNDDDYSGKILSTSSANSSTTEQETNENAGQIVGDPPDEPNPAAPAGDETGDEAGDEAGDKAVQGGGVTNILTNISQEKKNIFRKFIGLLNNGSIDSSSLNIKGNNILLSIFNNSEKEIKKQFEKNLSLSIPNKSKPLIIYRLYKIEDNIRKIAKDDNLDILNYHMNDNERKMFLYKFSVNYKCVIVDNTLYYQKNINIINLYEEKNGDKADHHNYHALEIPPNELLFDSVNDGKKAKRKLLTSMITHTVKGGINRKLKRKELNTMSLNELKQLHRNNDIKINGNKTVNALIDNYIKNYK